MTRPTPVEAVLQTGAIETPYHRAGDGAPVVLLFTEALADPAAGQLFTRLAERFRVVAPVPPRGVPFAPWLRDLIDGLGLVRPALIAEAALAAAALQFSLSEPERVGDFVAVLSSLLPDGCSLFAAGPADRLRRT